MAGGNIEAIRDWANKYYYNNDEIADAFIKAGLGLTAYKLTIIGDSGTQTITIIEDAQNDPQTYTINTVEGEYTGIFFFHSGSTIQLYDNGVLYCEHVLSNTVDTIYLRPLVSAIPVMTSDATPTGTGIASASGEMTYSGNTYGAWRIMRQVSHPEVNWVDPSRSEDAWVQFQFNTAVKIKKARISIPAWVYDRGYRFPSSYELRASNDGTNWTTLISKNIINYYPNHSTPKDLFAQTPTETYYLKGTTAYTHYRIVCGKTGGNGTHLDEMTLYKLQDS